MGTLKINKINYMDSLLNETKLNFQRGQKIRWVDTVVREGRYVMSSSVDGYIVISLGGRYGTPKIIPLNSIIHDSNK